MLVPLFFPGKDLVPGITVEIGVPPDAYLLSEFGIGSGSIKSLLRGYCYMVSSIFGLY